MTTLEAYAAHGSVSYGEIAPARLREILLGDAPRGHESARVGQAMLETPVERLPALAAEIGISADALTARTIELCGNQPGSCTVNQRSQVVEIDGEKALVTFDPDTRKFRGEFVDLNGGADFCAESVVELIAEGRRSLAIFLDLCNEKGIDPRRRF